MNNKFTDFPYYRMLSERKVLYKIISDKQFIELSWIGDKKHVFNVQAHQYPELLRIMEMLDCVPPFIEMPLDLECNFE